MSQIEWKTTEIRASKVGNFSPFSCPGLSVSVDGQRAGFSLRVSGFSDKAMELLDMAATKLRDVAGRDAFTDRELRAFESERDELARRCSDAPRDEPAYLVSTWARHALDANPDALDADALNVALKDDAMTLPFAAKVARERLAEASLEVYVAGNADDAAALRYADVAAKARADSMEKGAANEPPPDAALALPRGDFGVAVELRALREADASRTLFLDDAGSAPPADDDDPNSAIEMFFQIGRGGDDDDAEAHGWPDAATRDAAATLLGRLAQASAFNRLRTVEQLGYIADAGLDATHGVLGFRCLLQSATGLDPPALEDRVDAWLRDAFLPELADMADGDLETKKTGLALELLQRPSSLRDVVARDWQEISSRRRKFSHVKARAARVRDVTRADLLKLLQDHIAPGAAHRRLLRTRVYAPGAADARLADGGGDDPPGAVVLRSLESLRAFKRGAGRWAPPKRWDEGPGPDAPAT